MKKPLLNFIVKIQHIMCSNLIYVNNDVSKGTVKHLQELSASPDKKFTKNQFQSGNKSQIT